MGVAPDDLDGVAEREDEGYTADKVAHKRKCRECARDDTAHGGHGVAVLVVSDHARDRGARKCRRDQSDADDAAHEGGGERQACNRDDEQQHGGSDGDRAQKTTYPQRHGTLMEHAGSAGGCAWKDKLKQDGDKAGGKRRGNDAADNVVGRRGVLVLGPVDLESSDLGALGPLGVL